ncbi:MAG: DsbA family protein [Rhodobacter sp.]|nr:DsbA family protein [Rhodobacter sp.]MCY4168965.1 DsbA family protein [Rhodobacter sp.]MCY4243064.1 DsbA family protein [Rhodobacter sp.]
MLKQLATAAMALSIAGVPAAAHDIGAMTVQEREELRAEIRSFLLDEPQVLLDAFAVLEEREQNERARADMELVQMNADQLFNDGHSWIGGNPDGDVTVVEFIDYRCGFCRRAHPEVGELIASDSDIRHIIKELPVLGEQSLIASRFALAVKHIHGDDAYAETHDALMTMRGDVSDVSLAELSRQLGYETEVVFGAMDDEAVERAISENHALAQRLGINGTPGFVFGDRMVRGYIPLEQMRGIVAELREG